MIPITKSYQTILLTLTGFAGYFLLKRYGMQWLFDTFKEMLPGVIPAYFLASAITCLPLLAGVLILHKTADLPGVFGLTGNFTVALLAGLIATVPMWLGSALLFRLDPAVTLNQIIILTVFAPFFEELVYRGFLFGQLFRFSTMGFIPAVLINAVIFGAGHLYQSNDPMTLAGVFITTLMGGALFAWLYAEWAYNLWVPVMLHLFMNLSWILFSVSDNALGGVLPNIFRGLTIALIISGTLYYKRRKAISLAITRPVLWYKPLS